MESASLERQNENSKAQVVDADIFLDWLFGRDNLDRVYACTVNELNKGWFDGDWSKARRRLISGVGEDGSAAWLQAYYSIGVFPEDRSRRRLKSQVTGVVAAVLDDVGTKADPLNVADIEANQWVGAKIETSPGNEQWVIKYKASGAGAVGVTGERALQLHVLTMNTLASLDLTDKVSDIARYVRLPAGRNLKKDEKKHGFEVKLLGQLDEEAGAYQLELASFVLRTIGHEELGETCEWQAGIVGSDVDAVPDDLWNQIVEILRVQGATTEKELRRGAGTDEFTANVREPDEWLRLIMELGERLDWRPPEQMMEGVVDFRCPFAENHSDVDLDGARYLGGGYFKCHHNSCKERTFWDFRDEIEHLWNTKARREGEPEAAVMRARYMFEGALEWTDEQLEALGLGDVRRIADAPAAPVDEDDIERLLSRYWFVKKGGQRGGPAWWDSQERCVIGKEDIEAERDVIDVFGLAGRRPATPWKALRQHEACQEFLGYVSIQGAPVDTVDEEGNRCINIWKNTKVVPKAGKPTKYLEFMDWFLGVPGTLERDEIDKYLAWILQNPGKKAPRIVVFIGGEGTGKDLWMRMLGQLVNPVNVAEVSLKGLNKDFNEWQQKRIVYINEAEGKGRYDLMAKLKSVSGGGAWITVNKKNEPVVRVRDCSLYFLTTNDYGALPVKQGSRRELVIDCPAAKHEDDQAFYGPLFDAMAEEGTELGQIMRHYLEMDLTGYAPYSDAPATSAKLRMAHEGHSQDVQEILDALADAGFNEKGISSLQGDAFVSFWAVAQRVNSAGKGSRDGKPAHNKSIGEALKTIGWMKTGMRPQVVRDGAKRQVFVWCPKHLDRVVKAAKDDIARQKILNAMAHADSRVTGNPIDASGAP